jgi:hypothetical protein
LTKRRRENAKQKANNIKTLKPVLGDLCLGRRPAQLDWAMQFYFSPPNRNTDHSSRSQRIVQFTDQKTADAIFAGCEYLATVDLIGVDAAKLGRAEAEGRRYCVEWPAIAGLDRLFEEERLPDPGTMPITLAIVVIKSNFIVEDQERRTQLQQWAIQRLDLNPALGALQLVEYMGAILDAGATQLNAITWLSENSAREGAVAQAIDELLAMRPRHAGQRIAFVIVGCGETARGCTPKGACSRCPRGSCSHRPAAYFMDLCRVLARSHRKR